MISLHNILTSRAAQAFFVFFCFTLFTPGAAFSQFLGDTFSKDEPKTWRPNSWILLPNISYSPETGALGGVLLGFYHRPKPESRPSNTQLITAYTQRHQILTYLDNEWYFRRETLRLESSLAFLKYPDRFYGIGPDTPEEGEEEFTSRSFGGYFVVQQRVERIFWLGMKMRVRHSKVIEREDGGLIASRNIPGIDSYTASGAGFAVALDNRDHLYAPSGGTYAQAMGLFYGDLLGSGVNFQHLVLDVRHYLFLAKSHVLAFQAYFEGVLGEVPFEMLPRLGGSRLLRGILEGRFRDKLLAAIQAEYRFPLFWRFGGAIFGGAGKVAPRLTAFDWEKPEWTVGAGLRFRLNAERVKARMDFGTGEEGSGAYFELHEAY